MYGAEEKARQLGLRGKHLRAHRRKYIRPIAKQFEQWLAAVKPTLLPSEPLMAAVQYHLRHRDALFRFIDDPEVPIDNSATERARGRILPYERSSPPRFEGEKGSHVLVWVGTYCQPSGILFRPDPVVWGDDGWVIPASSHLVCKQLRRRFGPSAQTPASQMSSRRLAVRGKLRIGNNLVGHGAER